MHTISKMYLFSRFFIWEIVNINIHGFGNHTSVYFIILSIMQEVLLKKC